MKSRRFSTRNCENVFFFSCFPVKGGLLFELNPINSLVNKQTCVDVILILNKCLLKINQAGSSDPFLV